MHLIDFKWLKLKAWRVKVEHKCVRDFNILNIFTGAEILALTISWSRWEFAVYVHLLCWTVSGLILWTNKRSCLLIHQNNEKGCKHNRNNITYKSFCCWCQKGNRKGLISPLATGLSTYHCIRSATTDGQSDIYLLKLLWMQIIKRKWLRKTYGHNVLLDCKLALGFNFAGICCPFFFVF